LRQVDDGWKQVIYAFALPNGVRWHAKREKCGSERRKPLCATEAFPDRTLPNIHAPQARYTENCCRAAAGVRIAASHQDGTR
jgi:hypothetical protein